MMRYYTMGVQNKMSLPKAEKGLMTKTVTEESLKSSNKIDYDIENGLISQNLKNLMELYMLKYDFKPFVYMVPVEDQLLLDYIAEVKRAEGNKVLEANLQPPQPNQATFWRFTPPKLQLNVDYKATFRPDGVITHISFLGKKMPIVFTAVSPNGVSSIVVRMAVAESALRRNFFSLKFTKILGMEQDN